MTPRQEFWAEFWRDARDAPETPIVLAGFVLLVVTVVFFSVWTGGIGWLGG